uniref:F-box domain-containing protein n=1 Tax=Acrobeloides nanus TaxID=290746 RepID=A0A914DA19_9BILA
MKRRSPHGKCPRESKEARILDEWRTTIVFERNMDFQHKKDYTNSSEEVEEARMKEDIDALTTDSIVNIEHLSEDKSAVHLRIDDVPLMALARVASNLSYDDLQNFRLVNRQFYFAERAQRHAHTKFSIELVKQLFPKHVHYAGNTMFSMGRALIATLRYLAQTAINIKEIDLEGLYVFSASHFNDVVQKSQVPAAKLFKKVEVISGQSCSLSFNDLEWFAKYAPNVIHIKVVEEPLLVTCDEKEGSSLKLKEMMDRILKRKQDHIKWSSNRRKVVLQLLKSFSHLQQIDFY